MILLTGAGGQVGGALAELLPTARVAFHDPAKAVRAAGRDAVVVDTDRPETLAAAFADVETAFLLTAIGPGGPEPELALVRAAVAAGVRRVVKLSVWRAPDRLTPIAVMHRAVEREIETSGLAWTFLRPNFYLQNFVRQFAASIRTANEFAQPPMAGRVSFVDTRDIARAAAAVLTGSGHDGIAYDLTGPAALSYPEAAEVLSTVLGRHIAYRPLTDEQARAGMLARGLSADHVQRLIEVSRAYRAGGADQVSTAVPELTGRPATSLAEFAADHRDAFG